MAENLVTPDSGIDFGLVFERLGFDPTALGYKFNIDATEFVLVRGLNDQFVDCYSLFASVILPRTLSFVKSSLPLQVESYEQGLALLAYPLKGIRFDHPPTWLEEGRKLSHLLPWEIKRSAVLGEPDSPRVKGPMSRRLSESKIVAELSERICQRLIRKVVGELQRMDDALLSGEDSGLQNTWDEICVQVQQEESTYWPTYLITVRTLVEAHVEDLLPFERDAIWLQTPEGEEWDLEDSDERFPYPVMEEDISNYLLDEVFTVAADWTNARIRAYIYRGYSSD